MLSTQPVSVGSPAVLTSPIAFGLRTGRVLPCSEAVWIRCPRKQPVVPCSGAQVSWIHGGMVSRGSCGRAARGWGVCGRALRIRGAGCTGSAAVRALQQGCAYTGHFWGEACTKRSEIPAIKTPFLSLYQKPALTAPPPHSAVSTSFQGNFAWPLVKCPALPGSSFLLVCLLMQSNQTQNGI